MEMEDVAAKIAPPRNNKGKKNAGRKTKGKKANSLALPPETLKWLEEAMVPHLRPPELVPCVPCMALIVQ